jgi:hypothetical protein
MNKTIVIIASLMASTASAADMALAHHTLTPQVDMLASELAQYRAITIACRPTDGTILSRAYWQPRLSIVPASQKEQFTRVVKARSAPIIASMSGPDRALRCDDALDIVENAYPSIFEGGPAAEPVCWSDVTGMNACPGIGDDDILAGVDALLEGY